MAESFIDPLAKTEPSEVVSRKSVHREQSYSQKRREVPRSKLGELREVREKIKRLISRLFFNRF